MSRLTALLLDMFEQDLASDGDALALRLQHEVKQAAANAEELTYAAVRSRKRKVARVSKKASKADDGK